MQMWREKKELPPIYVSKQTAADLMCYVCAIKVLDLAKGNQVIVWVHEQLHGERLHTVYPNSRLRHKSIQIDSIMTD